MYVALADSTITTRGLVVHKEMLIVLNRLGR